MLLPFDRFRCLRCCVVMAELPSSAESCIEPVWIATQTHLTQAGDFSSWVLGVFFLFLRLMTLPPLYSGVMCNADSGARRARPVKSSIFPSLAPSPNTSTCEEGRTYQHFCRLRANSVRSEAPWVFVNGVCAGRPPAFNISRLNKDQEQAVELIFFVETHNRKLPDCKCVVLFFMV